MVDVMRTLIIMNKIFNHFLLNNFFDYLYLSKIIFIAHLMLLTYWRSNKDKRKRRNRTLGYVFIDFSKRRSKLSIYIEGKANNYKRKFQNTCTN